MVESRRISGTSERGRLRVVPGGKAAPVELSDSDLIDAFERGEGHACEQLYDRLIGVVEGTLYKILGRRDQAHDDLVQTAFEQIVLTLSKRRFARACSLTSWASSVTTHVAFNVLRSRTRERKVVDHDKDGTHEANTRSARVDLEREADVRQTLAQVRVHLAEMSEHYATTLFLHDVLGHELSEISVLTAVSVSAAQSRLVRARKELRKRLAQGPGGRRS
ncbi:MAG TPA: RNA polymerase sigma factor [Polyangiaceae bacterium]|nr:RNA polymerase sigma factor [Polyangiaceae bacterium]